MSAARTILHWFSVTSSIPSRRDPKTPKGCRVLLADGTSFEVEFGNWADRTKVSERWREVIGHVTFLPATGRWAAQVANPFYPDATLYTQEFTDAALAAAAARKHLAEFVAREEAVRADPVGYLDRELSLFDWYAHMSDDDSVYRGSEAHWNNVILPLKAKVGDEVFEALRAKHFPKGA